ncbi:asparagine synthase (glutamine-hydrolyzing) [uncultured Thiodictyon sp.]|uniref:asparagine synthase (glutamine-hydrolyzing) n=1 Tax=uncultured Thiodictyon sp. TaxID=1846217 RepID=UPI0025ED302B|nr:asparagine synthase (glutamine-hydrolyzing) [uncultured Thiodictyon sp.]
MCGLAGWVGPVSPAPWEARLHTMIASLGHRGPDGMGFAVAPARDGSALAALGHRRLAIIDLTGGGQPMRSATGTVVVFNGEIYNFRELRAELTAAGHRFVSHSDTEVLLHGWRAWGRGMPERLRGMFAFALWDPLLGQLFIARDRFGKKPLFLMAYQQGLAFASEIKALLTLPEAASTLDQAALGAYFTYGFTPGPATLFEGIRKLQAGCALLWERGRPLQEWRWYLPPDGLPFPEQALPADPVAAFLREFQTAVGLRLISDVPLGAFLSGGLDSSAIVAVMTKIYGGAVQSFSMGFEDQGYSELPYADEVAAHLGCEHHRCIIHPEDLVNLLPEATRFRDAPVSDPADLPLLALSRMAATSVKVVLSGEGSDEVLAGYPKYLFERFAPLYQRLVPAPFRRGLVEPLTRCLPYRFRRAKTLVASLGTADPAERMARWFGSLSHADRDRLIGARNVPMAMTPCAARSPLRAILCFDQSVWLPDNLLERGDRMTMAAGLEARNPFLDHRLVAFAAALPERYRIRGLTTKWILRQAVKPLLPERILRRPKVGFRLPLNEWFRRDMRDFVLDHLDAPDTRLRACCANDELQRIVGEHLDGRQNHEKLLWMLLSLEVFLRTYGLSP